jgi:hypothetical protein
MKDSMKETSIRKIIAHRPGLDRHLPVSQPFFSVSGNRICAPVCVVLPPLTNADSATIAR